MEEQVSPGRAALGVTLWGGRLHFTPVRRCPRHRTGSWRLAPLRGRPRQLPAREKTRRARQLQCTRPSAGAWGGTSRGAPAGVPQHSYLGRDSGSPGLPGTGTDSEQMGLQQMGASPGLLLCLFPARAAGQ